MPRRASSLFHLITTNEDGEEVVVGLNAPKGVQSFPPLAPASGTAPTKGGDSRPVLGFGIPLSLVF